ncbi:AzlC family ABC transporter permease, partial [Rhizobiaceae sp. 2RAB30]
FFMCDESWALALADARKAGSRLSLGYYLGVAAGLYVTWVVFTTIGTIIGPELGDITRYGFDMAFPAVFLVMLAGMWKG